MNLRMLTSSGHKRRLVANSESKIMKEEAFGACLRVPEDPK